MDRAKAGAGIVFVGPGQLSQGGISTVIGNYSKTAFWQEFDCRHFSSTADLSSTLIKLVYGAWRIAVFAVYLLVSRRPWAISIHTAHRGSFYRKLCYLVIARLFQVPAVLHVHPAAFAEFYADGSGLRKRAIRLAGRLSDRIVFLSDGMLDELADVFPATKLSVLVNPVDIQRYRTDRRAVDQPRPRVLFLGWIIADKGVYDLVEAIPTVLKVFPDALFTFAGNKEVDRLRDLIARRRLQQSAEVVGWVEGEKKLALLRSSSLLILPSYTEGMPNVILEAMASKLPIVTTPVGAIPSVLTHDETAVFVEPGNVESIANGVMELLGDAHKSAALAEAAFARALRRYSLEAVGEELTHIYAPYRPFNKGYLTQ